MPSFMTKVVDLCEADSDPDTEQPAGGHASPKLALVSSQVGATHVQSLPDPRDRLVPREAISSEVLRQLRATLGLLKNAAPQLQDVSASMILPTAQRPRLAEHEVIDLT